MMVLTLALAGCGDDTIEDDGNNGTSQAALTTYNVGLAKGFVPFASDRIAPNAAAIGASTSDVLCLQEVWDVEDVETVIAGAVGNYPHSYWVETMRDEVNAGCTDEEAAPLADCIRENCSDVPQDELANCGLANCGDEFSATSTECQTCVASNLDKDIDGILEACSGGGAAFSYSGRNGLILLSKTPLDNTQHTMLSSTLVQRAALRADVNVEGVGQVSVYCTHLAADLSGAIAYPGEEFASFEAEQAAQIGELIAWIDGQDNAGPIAWMGDFNTGPAGNEGVVAELPANYQLIVDSGYNSPFVAEGVCTYCDENTIVDDGTGTGGALIDHIFLKGLTASGVERSYDQKQTLATSEGEMELHLSDHYGVTVFINP
jgi:endonuclease/exonuclease/phosphatase family metal-dependent hydrolase